MVQPRKVNLDELARELSCTTAILADSAVTTIKIAPNAVTGNSIALGTITADRISLAALGVGLAYNSFTNAIDVTLAATIPDGSLGAIKFAPSVFGSGLVYNSGANAIDLNVDNSTIEVNADTVRIKDAGVTLAKLATLSVDATKLTASVAGNGLSGGAGSPLSVNVDGTTIQITADTLSVKPSSITTAYINVDADLTFNEHQALAFRLENVASDPVAGNPGRLVWRTDLMEVHVDTGASFISLSAGSGGHTIQDEGITLPQRAILNFVGAGVTVTDTGTKTQVSIPQGGHTIADEGTPVTQRAVLNFIGTGVTVTDGGTETDVTITSAAASYAKDLLTVTNVVSDHTIILSNTPLADSEVVSLNGLLLRVGATNDYTISGNTVTINAGLTLTIGDEFMIVYAY